LPGLIADEARGLAELEKDLAELPAGDARTWLERIAEAKRVHLTELEKLVDKSGGTA
jgi:rubrerythrin